MATKKKTETTEATDEQKAVAKVENTGTDLMVADDNSQLFAEMEGDKDLREQFAPAQLTIPRISVLQDLSPQVKTRDAEYVKGAEPGMIFNTVQRWLAREFLFVPSKFVVRYIAWQPRPIGGLVDQNLTLEECEANFRKDGIARWVGQMRRRPDDDELVRVEVIETPEWVGMVKPTVSADGEVIEDADWLPAAISFPSTKAKVVRDMNTLIDMTKVAGKDGRKFTPPPFYHLFKFDTAIESSGENEYFNFRAEHQGWLKDAEARGEAKELKLAFDRGEVEVDMTDTGAAA